MVGIVVLNFNGWDMTIKCIESLREACKRQFKVYIVDNASTIEMPIKFIKFVEKSKDCELIVSKKNQGYAAGNNLGIKKALEDQCSHIMVSNNDVLFGKKMYRKSVRFFR